MDEKFDFASSRDWLRNRQKESDDKNLILFKRALVEFDQIVDMIINKYNPTRIYQWGSLLNQSSFDNNSDIDIAIEGLGSAEKYFALLGDAMNIATFSLDLIEMEKIDPIDRETIRTQGKLVYERAE